MINTLAVFGISAAIVLVVILVSPLLLEWVEKLWVANTPEHASAQRQAPEPGRNRRTPGKFATEYRRQRHALGERAFRNVRRVGTPAVSLVLVVGALALTLFSLSWHATLRTPTQVERGRHGEAPARPGPVRRRLRQGRVTRCGSRRTRSQATQHS